MVFTMVLIGLTGQNAENALFEKSQFWSNFRVKKWKNLPLCRNGVISLSLRCHLLLQHQQHCPENTLFKIFVLFFDFPGFIYTIWEWTGAQLVVHLVLWPCPSRGSGQILGSSSTFFNGGHLTARIMLWLSWNSDRNRFEVELIHFWSNFDF